MKSLISRRGAIVTAAADLLAPYGGKMLAALGGRREEPGDSEPRLGDDGTALPTIAYTYDEKARLVSVVDFGQPRRETFVYDELACAVPLC